MMKKLISLLLTMILALGLLVPAALAGDFGEDEDYTDPGYYYVYTENGKVYLDVPGANTDYDVILIEIVVAVLTAASALFARRLWRETM